MLLLCPEKELNIGLLQAFAMHTDTLSDKFGREYDFEVLFCDHK
jgi:hypothetical protein